MNRKLQLLLVEDSEADARLIKEVMKEQNVAVDISVVRDGEEAMSYLYKQDGYENVGRPDLIVLDLNMPKKDGREVLAELKANLDLRSIPVLILTTSDSDEDILKSYKLQASCYVTKPMDLDKFSDIVKSLDQFWFANVRFPYRR